ncbi:Hsp20/alpha crystallin family protein [Roseicyclus sp.]|uniref:Hsp20/alpha crystallin family protein n=1 Tax=Roseicyclus sp. TaxID=1914329 RepID=UPI003F6CC5F4
MTKQSGSVDVPSKAPGEARSHGAGWAPLVTLRDEIDRLFDEFGAGLWRAPRAHRFDPRAMFSNEQPLVPALEMVDRNGHYEIKAELPGLAPSDIEVQIDAGMLTISGALSQEQRAEKADFLVSERHYGAFRRSLRLPPAADPDQIAARLAQGVLTITIPKTANARETARKIAIKAA